MYIIVVGILTILSSVFFYMSQNEKNIGQLIFLIVLNLFVIIVHLLIKKSIESVKEKIVKNNVISFIVFLISAVVTSYYVEIISTLNGNYLGLGIGFSIMYLFFDLSMISHKSD